MDGSAILIGMVTGTIGTGYLAYGKKQSRTVPMISGALLIAYSYFTDNVWVLLVVGAALCAAPFVISE
jgi:hypothetical protein